MNRVLFSSNSDHWETPAVVFNELDREFGFTFDPCPINSAFDGLKVSWSGVVFCNPPYSNIQEFIKKGLWHLAAGECTLLCYLLPVRTDTAWFHDFCLKANEIRFLRGRLKFRGAIYNAPFPSMIVIFREWTIPPTPYV